jgi:hypothetical protein
MLYSVASCWSYLEEYFSDARSHERQTNDTYVCLSVNASDVAGSMCTGCGIAAQSYAVLSRASDKEPEIYI